ncbi:hypothetical protein [Azospirillum doebereinerae]
MPWVWELAALVRRYDQCMEDGDAGWPDDLAAAVDCYALAADIRHWLYAEAERFAVPLPRTGGWREDLGTIRCFIDGGGWQ